MQSTGSRPSIYEIDENVLDAEPYYFSDISIEKAAEILFSVNKEGAFLVRKRSTGYTPNLPYSLSVFYDNCVHHTRIRCDNNGQYLTETKDQNPKKFKTVQELVKFLNQEAILKLTTRYNTLVSSFRSDYEPKKEKEEGDETHEFESLNDLPYYLGNCKKETAEKILQDIKQNETFFIINSTNNTPKTIPFELLVYYKSFIYNLKIKRYSYDAYSIETSELHFNTIPDLIKHFNYNKLKVSSGVNIKLQIHSKYINIE